MNKQKGKILKIKPGYQTNCSSGMWIIGYFFVGGWIGVTLSAISFFIAREIKKKLEKNK